MSQKENAISITLKDNKSAYMPGELLEGTIRWEGEKPKTALELRIGWIISNDTTLDVMCHSSENYVLEGRVGTRSFEVILPMGPHTIAARLFKIQWILEAQTKNKEFFLQVPICISAKQ